MTRTQIIDTAVLRAFRKNWPHSFKGQMRLTEKRGLVPPFMMKAILGCWDRITEGGV